ncbi:MAG TPA: xylanase [Planctomycetaceae bacterium]|nr:xylanase [Planctomycetaceae bacterium]
MTLRPVLLLILSCLLCVTATAEETKRIRLWGETPPGPASKANGDEQDITKATDSLVGGSRIIKLGNVSAPELHIFLPSQEVANRGAMLVCPGGGFSILAWDLEGTEVAHWLNSLGFAAAVLKYRVPTRGYEGAEVWQGPVMDAQRGLSVIRDHADQWNIDPDRVGILGFSAGGQVAARAALAKGKRLYAPLDKIDQSSCNVNFAILVYPAWIASDSGDLNEGFEVDGQSPPMFFVHAVNDRVSCMSSVALFAALKKVDVPAELHIFADGGHGYGLRETELPVTRWPSVAADWLNTQILVKSPEDLK